MLQWINLNRHNMSIFYIVRKNWPYPPTASGSYGKVIKIFYKLNYLDFHFVQYHCNVTTVLELHFSRLLSSKAYFKVCLKCDKFGCHVFHVNPYY